MSSKSTEPAQRVSRDADYPLTALVINPINRALVPWVARTRIAPNAVTVASFALGLAAAAALYAAAAGLHPAAGVGAIALVFLSHLADTMDGDLARYTGRTSELGRGLDPILDRGAEAAMVAGVAAGLDVAGAAHAWPFAFACASGVLAYYYATDAWVGPAAMRAAGTRYSVALGTGARRIKLGLFEPFLYGLPVATAVGLGEPALAAFAALFWLGWTWQIAKLVRVTR